MLDHTIQLPKNVIEKKYKLSKDLNIRYGMSALSRIVFGFINHIKNKS